MNELERTEKITVGNTLTRLLQGAVLGLTSMIPFFQVKDLKETLGMRDKVFQKEAKTDNKLKNILTDSIHESEQNFPSFIKTLLWYIAHRWSYMLGFFIGFLVFFFIPVGMLKTEHNYAIYGGMMALSLGFLLYELKKMIAGQYSYKLLRSLAALFIGIIFSLVLALVTSTLIDKDTFALELGMNTNFLLLLILFFASFILSYTGMSLGTIFYLSSTFLAFSSLFNNFLYEHTNISMIIFALIGIVAGNILAVFAKRYLTEMRSESGGFNAGVYLFSLLWIGFTELPKYISKESPEEDLPLYETITIITTVAGCLLIAFMLTVHGFQLFNQKDYQELNNLSDAEVNTR
ncbi:MAG: hypothetical protein K5762_06005 [Bacilli bacterium]|nr:hypothetical protein [Bacilli bacterium]